MTPNLPVAVGLPTGPRRMIGVGYMPMPRYHKHYNENNSNAGVHLARIINRLT